MICILALDPALSPQFAAAGFQSAANPRAAHQFELRRCYQREMIGAERELKKIVCGLAVFAALTASPGSGERTASVTWKCDHAMHWIGLPDVKAETSGVLIVSPTEVLFTSAAARGSIDRARIISVSVGDERVETGGKEGRLARFIAGVAVPYGAGSLLGLVTQGQVDLLTIEFRDNQRAYHGVVFVLGKGEADRAKQALSPINEVKPQEPPHPACLPNLVKPLTLEVSAFSDSDAAIPREYRAAFYEQLIERLRIDPGFAAVYRDGDDSPAAACSQFTLSVTIRTFRKGNAVLRASSGMIGNMLAATKLSFHMTLRDQDGKAVLDGDVKAAAKGDHESLDVALNIAKRTVKKLNRQMKGGTLAQEI
jgi:hypothetical protein